MNNNVQTNTPNQGNIVNIDKPKVVPIVEEKNKTFTYKARGKAGKVINDTVEASSLEDAKNYLLSNGFQIIKIKEDKLASTVRIGGTSKPMKTGELVFFLTQLSTYIKSGIPLTDAMAILSRQTKKKNTQKVFSKIVYELNKGVPFSKCLANEGKVFPKMLINMAQTSELTGNLTEVLDEMAEYYKRKDTNRKQIISALTYPTVILIFAVCILAFVIMYIVPEFTDMYGQLNSELPKLTKAVVAFSDFVVAYKFIILFGIIAVVLFLNVMYKNITSFRYAVQYTLMHIPVIKEIIIYNDLVIFTSTFASLLKYDVFRTDSMEILGKVSNNEIYKKMIKNAVLNLSNGAGLAPAFKGQWAFPVPAYEMLLTGEKTGKLGPMMEHVSKYYSEEQTNIITRLKSLIEPIMIILLAIIVGVILLAVVLPMFSIYKEMV